MSKYNIYLIGGFLLFFVGLFFRILAAYIKDGTKFQASRNPELGGMLLDISGMAIITLSAILIAVIISKRF